MSEIKTSSLFGKITVMLVLLSVGGSSSFGKTIYVDDDDPADFNNIQAAINDANDGDVIEIQPGRYTGPGNRDIIILRKAITICSTAPNDPKIVATTIIDCNGTSQDNHRGFSFINCEDANLIIAGLTITNGCNWAFGGAIYISNSRPSIYNCTFIQNKAYTVADDGFPARGGAVFSHNSSPTIEKCNFIHNSLWGFGPGPSGEGGGLYDCNSSSTVTNCIFLGNSASVGSGICSYSSMFVITNCTFTDDLGCIYAEDLMYQGTYPSDIILTNCIFRDPGDEIRNFDGSSIYIAFSNVQGGQAGLYDPCNAIIWGTGNIDTDPCFADPGNNNYHLKSQAGRYDPTTQSWVYDDVTSPCIDVGDPLSPIGAEPFPNGGVVNMGAYGATEEASKSYFGKPPCEIIVAGDVNGDCLVNFLDFRLMALHWCEDNSP